MSREDIPDLKMNVDPNLKPDTILTFGDDTKISYADFQMGHSMHRSDPIKCLVYWDDICQFTSVGLIEVINALYGANAKVSLNHFFSRPNEYDFGIKYVYKLFEKVIPKDSINKIKKEFYWKIMQISLKSELFDSLNKMNSCFTKLAFYFPFPFENCEKLKGELTNLFFTNHGINGTVEFYYASNKVSFNELIKKHDFNTVITPNIATTYEYIIKNNLKKISIIGPDEHNGLTPELYEFFYKYRKFPRPNYCKVAEFPEKIFVTPEL